MYGRCPPPSSSALWYFALLLFLLLLLLWSVHYPAAPGHYTISESWHRASLLRSPCLRRRLLSGTLPPTMWPGEIFWNSATPSTDSRRAGRCQVKVLQPENSLVKHLDTVDNRGDVKVKTHWILFMMTEMLVTESSLTAICIQPSSDPRVEMRSSFKIKAVHNLPLSNTSQSAPIFQWMSL